MADKELRRMNRTELIEIIYALQQNEKELRGENEELRRQLEDRLLHIERAGSIAEAAISLNHVFEDAESAAQQYLVSIQNQHTEAEQTLKKAREQADKMIASAQAEVNLAAQRIQQTEDECRALREQTAAECAALRKKAQALPNQTPDVPPDRTNRRCLAGRGERMSKTGTIDRISPGRRFGMLTVESDTGLRKNRYAVWRCRCDCGNEIKASTKELKEKKICDCGCTTHVGYGANDLTGQRFGKLRVLYPTKERTDQGSLVWHAVCDCGRECDVSARRLTRGKVRSCGCLSSPPLKDYVGKRFGRWTVVAYAGTAADRGLTGTMQYWKCRCDCGKEGIVGQTELQNGDSQSCGCLHTERVLESMKLIDGTSVVRLETSRDKIRSNNVSGKTGVCFITRDQKWAAYITLQKKRYRLGLFKDKDEAIRARTRAEEMHEEFIDWYYQEYLPAQEPEQAVK
ncbi:MAG: hypothetical protein LIO45_07280 [Clostridiales bacterium]|nr:hypothetical protein [Clostridiales bacterium]